MADIAPPAKAARGRSRLLLVVAVVAVFGIGIAAGVVAGGFFGKADAPHPEAPAVEEVAVDPATRLEVEVGRITVVIPASGGRTGTRHLLVTPLVIGQAEGEPAAEAEHGAPADEAAPGPVPELRDAFIEYLSQLHESDVRGSAGLLTLRQELLRRARTVAPELNASAVLIQEFLIQ
ncbi:flagellar basal body-associated protein FliL [Tabrizicola sp.]|uniref:flagellar basal body-associated FliL family protein n=1 Tax=Tabrizicola sp. TaxID=2005166 RepID=UPI0035B24BFA